MPKKLCELWPKVGERCSAEECLDVLRKAGLEQTSLQQVGRRLVSSASKGTLAALLRDLHLDIDCDEAAESKKRKGDSADNNDKREANNDNDDAGNASDDSDSDDEDGSIVVLDSLDEAQFLIERLRLARIKINSDSLDKLLLSQLSYTSSPFDRFRILAKGLSGSSILCPLLREKVQDGSAKLRSFATEEVIIELAARVSCVHILLFGSVAAFSDSRRLVARHTDALHLFGEESLAPASSIAALGYRASSQCVLLSIEASSLTESRRNTLLEVIRVQHLAFKNLNIMN